MDKSEGREIRKKVLVVAQLRGDGGWIMFVVVDSEKGEDLEGVQLGIIDVLGVGSKGRRIIENDFWMFDLDNGRYGVFFFRLGKVCWGARCEWVQVGDEQFFFGYESMKWFIRYLSGDVVERVEYIFKIGGQSGCLGWK